MEGERKVFSVAFEGMHRVGKGTQIELLKKKLESLGIPTLSIRGEGFRSGKGEADHDPSSDYWQVMSEELRNGGGFEKWEEASHRLARELIVWRDRILKQKIENEDAPYGVLLVDRSLISKTILHKLQQTASSSEPLPDSELYPEKYGKRKKITPEMVLPDLIIEFVAPQDVLLSRLDKSDVDYEFRKNNIINNYELYTSAKESLPTKIRERIITLDASKDVQALLQEVIGAIKSRFKQIDDLL